MPFKVVLWGLIIGLDHGKSQRVKTQRSKLLQTFAEEKMFAEDISEDFSEDRRYHFCWNFIVIPDIFEIFVEDCFLLRSFGSFKPLVLILKPFQRKTKGGGKLRGGENIP